jgi:sialic acid synthase SpsE
MGAGPSARCERTSFGMPTTTDPARPATDASAAQPAATIGDLRRLAEEAQRAYRPHDPAGRAIFEDLFVLELANNHWGSLERGLRIVSDFAEVVHRNAVKAAIKLQFRDVDSFIHKDFRASQDIRYVKKVSDTHMAWEDLRTLVEAVRAAGLVTMTTPFDEVSVQKAVEFDVAVLKIASSDIRDRKLVPAIAAAGRPTIMSTGGSTLADIDAVVDLFRSCRVPLAINHCVSIYPSEDDELDLNQIDFLRARYPDTVIGLSTHEHHDWSLSVAIAYGKGARTFERHIDIDADGISVSSYCSQPHQADEWFRAFNRAKAMCGGAAVAKRQAPEKEVRYLDALVRGVYARRPIAPGEALSDANTYLAVPLLKGQMSCRELDAGSTLRVAADADAPVLFENVSSAVASDALPVIQARGLAA